ncbi:MAG: restriction endonuclease subunit S, partial [bacterium]
DHETAKIDTLIEKQQQLIKLLKEKRQAVISHAVTKGLNPDAPMRDSGVEWLGEVPERWKISQIGHCAFVTKLTGFEYTNVWTTSEEGEIIALRGFNVKERELDLSQTERISVELSQKLNRSKLSSGDIVFPCTGTIGNAALIESDNKFHINQNIAKICFNKSIHPKFAVYWLTSSITRKIIDRNNTSGMQPVVLIGDIRKLPIPRLGIGEQEQIVAYLDNKTEKNNELIGNANLAVVLLQERRTALISAAVTGKIDVRNWQPPTQNPTDSEGVP